MSNQVTLLKQWDERWGDYPYASSTMATSGCAPTCFAMIAQCYGINITPPEAANFAILNSFYPTPDGTSKDFFVAAGQYFGIPIYQTFDPNTALRALKEGIPCIAAHGPGEFAQQSHFIVYSYLTIDHQVMVNDPKRNDTCKLYPWSFLVQDNATDGYIAFVPSAKMPNKHS